MDTVGVRHFIDVFCSQLKPDPPLWVDEWAEQYMQIPADTGAAEPGKYSSSRTPFAVDIMRALSPDHPARRIVVKGASQILKTQVGINWICAIIDRAPGNILVIQPTDKLAKRVSARIDKTAKVVKRISHKIAEKKSRDKRNTFDTKEFPGGTLWILTGRSAANLSEASARYVYADEVDRILKELKGEGDPISLLEKRQGTFGPRAKGYYTSSPTEANSSRIHELFATGNQQRIWIPCPHCGEYQYLKWEQLHGDEVKAWYTCEFNGCMIDETYKPWMFERYEWRSDNPEFDGETHSFHVPYLYAPLGWDSWTKLKKEFSEAKVAMENGDSEKMRVFYNTRLAECWSDKEILLTAKGLMSTALEYPLGFMPKGTFVATAAADVQPDRIELQILAWGNTPTKLAAHVVGVHIVNGDTSLAETWEEFDKFLLTPIRHVEGYLAIIKVVAIDSGDGDTTQEVYEFVRTRKRRRLGSELQRIIAVKGASTYNKPIIVGKPGKVEYNYRGKPVPGGAEVWSIGTDTAKDWIFKRLGKSILFSVELDEGFYNQVLSETRVAHYYRGRKITRYEKISRNARNEQLDMLVYNLATAMYLQLNTYTPERWDQERLRAKENTLFLEAGTEAQKEKTAERKKKLIHIPD